MVNLEVVTRGGIAMGLGLGLGLFALAGGQGPARAQEEQGCFMRGPGRRLIPLNYMCPPPPPFLITSPGETGLGTGVLQVTLRWNTIDDLNLSVTGPEGQTLSADNRGPSAAGGQFDRDGNTRCSTLTESPLENAFWPSDTALEGEYSVIVDLSQRCSLDVAPVDFQLRVAIAGTDEVITGTVDEANPIFTYDFSLSPEPATDETEDATAP